jgi:hypothetical protein
MAAGTARDQGKSDFVRAALTKNAMATPKTVNKDWASAGNSGEISPSLVHKLRADMGLTGNLRARSGGSRRNGAAKQAKVPGRRRGRPPKVRAEHDPATNGGPAVMVVKRGPADNRARTLEELEAEVDRLIFRVMSIGELGEIEDVLRRARRLLVLAHHRS